MKMAANKNFDTLPIYSKFHARVNYRKLVELLERPRNDVKVSTHQTRVDTESRNELDKNRGRKLKHLVLSSKILFSGLQLQQFENSLRRHYTKNSAQFSVTQTRQDK